MPQNSNSVRSVAGISAQFTGALTELKKLKFVFGIQIVYFSEILRAKYPKLEYWSDENPSVITSRWRKRHFGITLFENTNFSTFKFSFKIPKTPPKIGTFQNQKTRGGENGMIFPGGENGISLGPGLSKVKKSWTWTRTKKSFKILNWTGSKNFKTWDHENVQISNRTSTESLVQTFNWHTCQNSTFDSEIFWVKLSKRIVHRKWQDFKLIGV